MSRHPPFGPSSELRSALALTGLVLVVLTLAKPIASMPWVGPLVVLIAAGLQLYLPLYRCDKAGVPESSVGLHLQTWKRDLRLVGFLLLWTIPPYVFLHYLFLTQGRATAFSLGWHDIGRYIPQFYLNPSIPGELADWWTAATWFLERCAIHSLGVALPEETFYRGYLQPQLQRYFSPRWNVFGVGMGWASVLAAFLFALGHFLGEWNPLRLAPFFPALIFAWQRNATGSLLGPIVYHASCNLVADLLSTQYTQAPP